MYTALIILDGIASIKKFVAISNKYEFKVNLKNKNCVVDGRSIMGIFSLDLTKPILLECPDGCSDKFIDEIKEFIYK